MKYADGGMIFIQVPRYSVPERYLQSLRSPISARGRRKE